MAWHADSLANNKASNTNNNGSTTNGNTNPNPQGGVAGHQFQSLLGENSDLLQRQLAAASHSDSQQHLLAAQLALQAQQNNPFVPWGTPAAAARPATPAGSSNTTTNGRSPSLAPKPPSIPPGMVGMGPPPSNPYGSMGFASLHHHHLPSHHHPLSSVGFPGGAAQFLNPAASASQFHQGIPSVMHQMVQMQMIQQQIQQMQQLQQHMQQQANAFSAANNAPAAASSSSTAPTSGEAAAGNPMIGSSDLFSMMKTMPGGMPGLGNPLPFAMPPPNTIVSAPPPSSLTNNSTAMGGNPLSSASSLQQLLRKSAISPEDQLLPAGVVSSSTTNKSPPTTGTTSTKSGSSNPSGSTTQKPRPVVTKRADESSVAVEPTVHDILSGRGNYVNNHDGNKNFRALVSSQRVMYVAAPKEFKPQFAKKIIEALKSLNPPGRFLQQDPDTKLWYELDEKKAMAKTRQALREGAPDVFKQITTNDGTSSSSTQNPDGDVATKEDDDSLVKSEMVESKKTDVSQVPSVKNSEKDPSDSNSSSAPKPKRSRPEKEEDASKSKKSESSEQPKEKKKKKKTNSKVTAYSETSSV